MSKPLVQTTFVTARAQAGKVRLIVGFIDNGRAASIDYEVEYPFTLAQALMDAYGQNEGLIKP